MLEWNIQAVAAAITARAAAETATELRKARRLEAAETNPSRGQGGQEGVGGGARIAGSDRGDHRQEHRHDQPHPVVEQHRGVVPESHGRQDVDSHLVPEHLTDEGGPPHRPCRQHRENSQQGQQGDPFPQVGTDPVDIQGEHGHHRAQDHQHAGFLHGAAGGRAGLGDNVDHQLGERLTLGDDRLPGSVGDRHRRLGVAGLLAQLLGGAGVEQ